VDLHPLGEEIGGRLVVSFFDQGENDRAVRTTASWPRTSRWIISSAPGRPNIRSGRTRVMLATGASVLIRQPETTLQPSEDTARTLPADVPGVAARTTAGSPSPADAHPVRSAQLALCRLPPALRRQVIRFGLCCVVALEQVEERHHRAECRFGGGEIASSV
jgi:hypothetical protein